MRPRKIVMKEYVIEAQSGESPVYLRVREATELFYGCDTWWETINISCKISRLILKSLKKIRKVLKVRIPYSACMLQFGPE